MTEKWNDNQEKADAFLLANDWPSGRHKALAAERMMLRHMRLPYRKLEVVVGVSEPSWLSRATQPTIVNTVVVGSGPKKVGGWLCVYYLSELVSVCYTHIYTYRYKMHIHAYM